VARITNLNHFRKDKARAERRARADANAARFGRTRAEKERAAAEKRRLARHLDGHKGKDIDASD